MSLVKQLKREVKTNPAKAAALGGLLLVAAWFWAPLLSGYFGSEGPAPDNTSPPAGEAVVPTAAAAPATPAPAAALTTKNDAAAYNWRKHANAIDEEPLMQSVAELPSSRDPFAAIISPEVERHKIDAMKQQRTAKVVKPADVGLSLTSTISGRIRVAEISGRSYRVGDAVRGKHDNGEATFRLVEIEPRAVILERDGQQFELKMPRPLVDSAASQMDSIKTGREENHIDADPSPPND